MWLLENEEAFGGRQLWLRPGKTYLFGRTAAEPGQLEISHNTISRKHLTISVDDVESGHAHDLHSRSRLTIEDLATKIGTTVDGRKIKGEKVVIESTQSQVIMGKCPHVFRLLWHPVVFTFSFTSKEMQNQPLTSLRERFEQLDIKLLTDYNREHTTHVVSKKRNTAKGLQALINARYIVTESFLDAVSQAAGPNDDESAGDASQLEQDFRQFWPDASEHLPPRGGEPVQHEDYIYKPDEGRDDVFGGYTFIFYDPTQYNNLLAPITNGCGKALLERVDPGETTTDDFVRFVKSVAGEKGLGSFEDGSEGRGVVLVRYLPAKGAQLAWYTDFLTSVSLQLDHRPIEQSEFLEAILSKNASILRRPLELEPAPSQAQPTSIRDIPQPRGLESQSTSQNQMQAETFQPSLPRKGPRRPVKRRFAGFADDDDEVSILDTSIPSAQVQNPTLQEEEGLFVSQGASYPEESQQVTQRRGSDLLDGMAEGSERYKRQKVAYGINSGPPSPEPERPAPPPDPKKKPKKTYDVMEMAAQKKREEEAKARAEEEDLARLPDDLDLAEIRKLNIVEEMPLRQSSTTARSRDQDITNGRWKPEWNGMQNFKKFRKRGATTGRAPARVIVSLTQVKTKEFGLGDDYWLENEPTQPQVSRATSEQNSSRSQSHHQTGRTVRRSGVVEGGDDEEDNGAQEESLPDVADVSPAPPLSSDHASPRKRPAPVSASLASTRSSKRPRAGQSRIEIRDSDDSADSDDELKFRFGRRR